MSVLGQVTTEVVNRQYSIVEILQMLILPVVLVALPIHMNRNKKARDATKTVVEQVGQTNGHGTLAHMAEQTLLTLGELRGDMKDVQKRFDEHAIEDKAFAEETNSRLAKIEERLSE